MSWTFRVQFLFGELTQENTASSIVSTHRRNINQPLGILLCSTYLHLLLNNQLLCLKYHHPSRRKNLLKHPSPLQTRQLSEAETGSPWGKWNDQSVNWSMIASILTSLRLHGCGGHFYSGQQVLVLSQHKIGSSLCSSLSDAYKVALAPHHPWFLRQAAELVFLALPDRQYFLRLVCVHSQEEALPVLHAINHALTQVHTQTQRILAERNMLELPWLHVNWTETEDSVTDWFILVTYTNIF